MGSTFQTLVSLVTTVETVDGKRLKCDRSLRRSIFCGVSSLLLFLPGLGVPGGGEWGSLNEILKCIYSKESC